MPKTKTRRMRRRDPHDMPPRMLGLTLTHIRQRPLEKTQEQLGKALDVNPTTIGRWENADSIDLAVLKRYQDWYGIPNGIILCISHLVASARDANLADSETERDRHRDNVVAIAKMMQSVATRVLKPDAERNETAITGYAFDADDTTTWGAAIEELLVAARVGASQTAIDKIKDLERYPDAIRQRP